MVALLAATALAGCGGGSDGDKDAGTPQAQGTPTAKPVGAENQGSVVQYADCGDWRKGSVAEKQATVIALRGQLTPQTSETAKSSLPDDRALEILDSACKPDFSKSLRLYKLYVRAQGFAPLGR